MNEVREFEEMYLRGLLTSHEMDLVYEGYLDSLEHRQTPWVRELTFGKFDLSQMSDRDVMLNFRFNREDLVRLVERLNIPASFKVPESGHNVPGLTSLCIMLRRLSYPNRLSDLEQMFGYSAQTLSAIAVNMIKCIQNQKGHLLQDLTSLSWLTHERLEYYSNAVAAKGAPLTNCWAFIDGTARQICRPTVDQRDYFSGHKRYHCLKYQSILAPDGIIVSLMGGYQGKRHDAGVWSECGVKLQLERVCVSPNKTYVLYGDPAYPISNLLIPPFSAVSRNPREEQFNRAMSAVRQAVEWGFGKVIRDFAFLDFHKNQKLLLQDVEAMYKVGVLMSNCRTIVYGNQCQSYFNVNPVSLEEYLT